MQWLPMEAVVWVLLVGKIRIVCNINVLSPENDCPNELQSISDPLHPYWPRLFEPLGYWLLEIGNVQEHQQHHKFSEQNYSVGCEQQKYNEIEKWEDFICGWDIKPPNNELPNCAEEPAKDNQDPVAPPPVPHLP